MSGKTSTIAESEITTCLRCGESYNRAPVHLRTVMQLGRTPIESRAVVLMELENISEIDATAWLRHNMHSTCEKMEAYCSRCGGKLPTWQAKWCVHCKYEWHQSE